MFFLENNTCFNLFRSSVNFYFPRSNSFYQKYLENGTSDLKLHNYAPLAVFSSMIKLVVTAKYTVISTNFLVWKFYGKAKFLHSLGEPPETINCT